VQAFICLPYSLIHIMPKGQAESCHDPFSGSSSSGGAIHIIMRKWAS